MLLFNKNKNKKQKCVEPQDQAIVEPQDQAIGEKQDQAIGEKQDQTLVEPLDQAIGEKQDQANDSMPQLSKRMQVVAEMVTSGNSVADIGCDHGYVSIWLAKSGRCPKCIAADMNKGPLKMASKNVALYGVSDMVETRLGDGLKVLSRNEVQSIIIAGMGGRTTVKILKDSQEVAFSASELILEPQSNASEVRTYLMEAGFEIAGEDFVREEDKFYPVIRAVRAKEKVEYSEVELIYGPCLLRDKNELLKVFLERQYVTFELIHDRLNMHNGYTCVDKKMELKDEKKKIRDALSVYGEINERDISLRVAEARRAAKADRNQSKDNSKQG